MKMRIKKYFLPCFLPVIAVLCFVLLVPAFADMKKVDEAELARANASVTGASDKDSNAGAVSAVGTPDKTVLNLYPPDSKDSNSFSLNVPLGAETTYYWHPWANNGTNQLYWGGGTTTTYIRSR
jgi:hypothetical protein